MSPIAADEFYQTGNKRKLTLADLHDAHDDDEGEGQQLAGGEDVLHPGGPPHAGAVHPCEQHWNTQSVLFKILVCLHFSALKMSLCSVCPKDWKKRQCRMNLVDKDLRPDCFIGIVKETASALFVQMLPKKRESYETGYCCW